MLDDITELKLADGDVNIKYLKRYLKDALQLDMLTNFVNGVTLSLLAGKKVKEETVKEILTKLIPDHTHLVDHLKDGETVARKDDLVNALDNLVKSNKLVRSADIDGIIKDKTKAISNQAFKKLPTDLQVFYNDTQTKLEELVSQLLASDKTKDIEVLQRQISVLKDDCSTLVRNIRDLGGNNKKIDIKALEESILNKVSSNLSNNEGQKELYYRTFKVFTQNYDGLVPKPTVAQIASNYVLRADGTWADGGGGGGSPAGSDTQIQFNDAGSFGADAGLTYNKTTNVLTVDGEVVTPSVQAASSAGGELQTNSGVVALHFGSGGSANGTLYGGWNYDNGTANTILSLGASKTLQSLSTATYPSLTELAYVKGVTSAIQTQIDTKTTGAASSTDNAIARFDGVTGKIIQNSAATIADTTGNITAGTYNGNTIGAGSTSGTNTGDQNLFSTIAVSGQSNVVADSATDTLTFVAGTNISITTDATTDSITINSTGGGITALTGDVTASGTGSVAATIANNAVTNAKAAQMAANTLKGNNTGSTANASDLTASQAKTLLAILAADISDFNTAVAANSAVVANTAKVTNATHTGEVTGATTLTLDKTAISNRSAVSPATGDYLLFGDASNSDALAKATISDILALGGGGGAADVQVFTSSGTWTKPSGKTFATIITIGGGGGGGSGRRGAAGTIRCGGGGGSGATMSIQDMLISSLGATETVTVGAGGAGGGNTITDDTNGNNGSIGGNSSFGGWTLSLGGNNGNGGGAGVAGSGGTRRPTVGNYGVASTIATTEGNGAASTASGGGASAGVNVNSLSPAGGGAGGGLTAANASAAGSAGGASGNGVANIRTGGTGGSSSGGHGGNGNTSGTGEPIGGSGGGGGGSGTSVGGRGGTGGLYGGGGGGGGASLNGFIANNGGTGGAGIVVVISY